MIGLGIDLVDVDRFRRSLARSPRLAERLFSADERAYAARSADPAERLAARFAAKEAVMKALGVGLGAFDFHDVEVRRAPGGRPTLELAGRALALAAGQGVQRWHLSLSHAGGQAMATAVAE